MFHKIGFGELIMLALVLSLILVPGWRIARKAGYPGPLALLLLIPGAQLILFWVFAFVEWPAERELRRLRGS